MTLLQRGETEEKLDSVVDALLAVKPIACAVESALRLRCPEALSSSLVSLARYCGITNVMPAETVSDSTFAEDVAGRTFAAVASDALYSLATSAREEQQSVALSCLTRRLPLLPVNSFDDTPLRTFSGGNPAKPSVVLVGACGMPAELLTPWLTFLSRHYFVVTWETRGLFPPFDTFDDSSCGVVAQSRDLIAVMDAHNVERAHVIAFCGGAVIALEACASFPERIASSSVWHGDFYGMGGPTTSHQRDVHALFSIALRGREDALAIQTLLKQSPSLHDLPSNISALVLYPYVTAELLYRYALLNGAIMNWDNTHRLNDISQMIDVITSDDDATVEPQQSRLLAGQLKCSNLTVLPHGDHLSLFTAPAQLRRTMRTIVDRAFANKGL